MTDDTERSEIPNAKCHYCGEDRPTYICKDWQTDDELAVCDVCRRDFDLTPVEDRSLRTGSVRR